MKKVNTKRRDLARSLFFLFVLNLSILSMTLKERRNPEIIKASRKTRIAKGSGTSVQEVNKLLEQFDQMKKMMKQISNGNFKMPF